MPAGGLAPAAGHVHAAGSTPAPNARCCMQCSHARVPRVPYITMPARALNGAPRGSSSLSTGTACMLTCADNHGRLAQREHRSSGPEVPGENPGAPEFARAVSTVVSARDVKIAETWVQIPDGPLLRSHERGALKDAPAPSQGRSSTGRAPAGRRRFDSSFLIAWRRTNGERPAAKFWFETTCPHAVAPTLPPVRRPATYV
jgi:hypothetical protein